MLQQLVAMEQHGAIDISLHYICRPCELSRQIAGHCIRLACSPETNQALQRCSCCARPAIVIGVLGLLVTTHVCSHRQLGMTMPKLHLSGKHHNNDDNTNKCVPARAGCLWRKSELARQICSEQQVQLVLTSIMLEALARLLASAAASSLLADSASLCTSSSALSLAASLFLSGYDG